MQKVFILLCLIFGAGSFEVVAQADTLISDFPEVMAEFPGGPVAMRQFLVENIHYPEKALKKRNQGTVYLRFVISESGKVTNVQVQRGIAKCKECEDEAVRVVKSMPNWKPGELNGEPINMYYNLPIKFKT